MTLVNCGYVPLPTMLGTSVTTAILLDAADEMAWEMRPIMRPGAITHLHYRTMTVTTGATMVARVEVPSTTGTPSGTLWATTTSGTQVIADADDNVVLRTALVSPAIVALGDIVVLVVANPTVSFGNLNIGRSFNAVSYGAHGLPYCGGPIAATKIDQSSAAFALEYSDGYCDIAPGTLPPAIFTAVTLDTGSAPDEAGIRFTALRAARSVGWWVYANMPAAITYRVALYVEGNTTPLATSTYDSDAQAAAGQNRMFSGGWDTIASGVILVVGTVYRVSIVALSATALTVYKTTAYSNAIFDTMGLPGAQYTVRTRSSTGDPDAAAWTETATARLQIGMIVDQLDDGDLTGLEAEVEAQQLTLGEIRRRVTWTMGRIQAAPRPPKAG